MPNACNPSYSEGIDKEDGVSNSSGDPISKKTPSKKGLEELFKR
jgi:hypothetical protein